jgi:hypothetical protein
LVVVVVLLWQCASLFTVVLHVMVVMVVMVMRLCSDRIGA